MDYYKLIKNELIDNEINKRVKDYSKNKYELEKYYNVGKLLSDAGKHYGEGILKEYSKKLTSELGKGYSTRNLRNMRQFYIISQKWQTVSAKLSWSHFCEVLWFDNEKYEYYLKLAEAKNLSIRQLRAKIKNKEYERLPASTRQKLIKKESLEVTDIVPNPIIIKNRNDHGNISEKVLQRIILEDIPAFLKELGNGFTFIDNEYKIKIGNTYNYIDVLLYNIEYNCYVVIELKVTELKKEHIGQIEVYMNYIDNNIRKYYQDKTIGIIITKKDNKFIMEYCSDPRILSREYKVI